MDSWENERITNRYVTYLQAEPLIGSSSDCHGRSYVVSSGRSTAGKSGHLNVLEISRGNENNIVLAHNLPRVQHQPHSMGGGEGTEELHRGLHNHYTEWKGNKCHPFNSRRGRLKGQYI